MRADRIRRLIQALSTNLFEKEETLRLAVLAAISQQNLFLYGPPGVAKSMIARRLPGLFQDARSFEYLLGRFSTPEELFGPVSITRLKNYDLYERVVEGFLPAAEIVFLDELWNASSPILNTLLTAISERRFRNGREEMAIPLKTVIGAAGTLPKDDPTLENLWDRFLLRLESVPVTRKESFLDLLLSTEETTPPEPQGADKIRSEELDQWQQEIRNITLPQDIQEFILDVRERISRHNRLSTAGETTQPIVVSDRRWKQVAHLLRTSAFLNDRAEVDVLDCILMRHCLWSRPEERTVVNTIIEEALYRYSTSGRFDPEATRLRLGDALSEFRTARYKTLQEEIDEPTAYRGEYYRLLDFVEDHLTLIWIGDFQNLSTEKPQETDLFFYGEADDFAYSERLPVRLIDPSTVEVAGEPFPVETSRVQRTCQEEVEVTAETKEALTKRLQEIRRETETTTEAVQAYRDAASGEAEQHLFVHRSYAEIVAAGMDQAARDFAELQMEIDQALHELE
ncbi:MoxR-like ATPase [Alkalispirochaeta americana]|uniref:MoxR-like ATPase n=1 Tax=Alkalispirochaeta americana TaxID=159291 RepID=A0A1N6TLT3_9SPIO|nr:AAA family ATPase [Alkalispirochaeta americana]SIQ54241.1 MoxR-like ATPase [Alkalispirochaeta americana]